MYAMIRAADLETFRSPTRVIERAGTRIRIEPGRVSITAAPGKPGAQARPEPTSAGAMPGDAPPAGRRDS
jgi:hypothetical protein